MTTQWSLILSAGKEGKSQGAALGQLCRTYWYPHYAYICRRGNGPEDAQDLTQGFFARLLEKQWLDGIEKNGSRFRSFLLSALNGYLADQYDRAMAAKRGAGQIRRCRMERVKTIRKCQTIIRAHLIVAHNGIDVTKRIEFG